MKTFYCGPGGWSEKQSPDGAVTFIAPTGHEYTTEPAGAGMYPALSVPTGTLNLPADTGPPAGNRTLAMPTRQRTRDQQRRERIDRERRIRAELNAQAAETGEADSPPF